MTTPRTYLPRARRVQAMRYLHGITTKQDLLGFCPQINIGSTDDGEIHWALAETPTGQKGIHPGNFIVVTQAGETLVYTAQEFNILYEEVDA